jgi:hypothetical protein
MAVAAASSSGEGAGWRIVDRLRREFLSVLPPTLFFFLGFQLILFTKQLILAQYKVQFSGFMIATIAALVVGKAVLVADKMPFLRRFDRAPLIQPILFKTVVYCLFVFVARLIEAFVRFAFIEGNGPAAFLPHLAAEFSWPRFIATQMWMFVLFLIYVTASELNTLFGDGELRRILFTYRPSELQMTRRQRIRELVRLSRLADANTIDAFRDPGTAAHRELVGIVGRLARRH